MTQAATMTEQDLKPCRECAAPCRVEVFGGGVHVTPATLWLCSKHKMFGGSCPSDMSYLTEDAWNERAATPTAPVQDDDAAWLLKKLLDNAWDLNGTEAGKRLERIASRLSPTPDTGLIEALTPSTETKAAYIGEFSLSIEEGEYGRRIIPVPWTTIKEIMAAIRKRALANAAPAQVESGDR